MAGNHGWQKWKWVAFFLAPSLIGLLFFIIYPIVSSLWLAFNDWNLLSPPSMSGWRTSSSLFADSGVLAALRYTLTFIVLYVPLVFVLGLGAGAVSQPEAARHCSLVRTATFLPVVASWVVVSLIWKWIFNPTYGLINYALVALGITGPAWLFDPQRRAVRDGHHQRVERCRLHRRCSISVGLQGISDIYYEAARDRRRRSLAAAALRHPAAAHADHVLRR